MFDNHYCCRCGKGYKWEEMTATPAGNLFCPDCWQKVDPKNEPLRSCPVDAATMQKKLIADMFVIDSCLTCGGVWLDKGELQMIEKKSKAEGWSQGYVIGMIF